MSIEPSDLRRLAKQAVKAEIAGLGNAMSWAADDIEALRRRNAELEAALRDSTDAMRGTLDLRIRSQLIASNEALLSPAPQGKGGAPTTILTPVSVYPVDGGGWGIFESGGTCITQRLTLPIATALAEALNAQGKGDRDGE